jgi:hypothetical protein
MCLKFHTGFLSRGAGTGFGGLLLQQQVQQWNVAMHCSIDHKHTQVSIVRNCEVRWCCAVAVICSSLAFCSSQVISSAIANSEHIQLQQLWQLHTIYTSKARTRIVYQMYAQYELPKWLHIQCWWQHESSTYRSVVVDVVLLSYSVYMNTYSLRRIFLYIGAVSLAVGTRRESCNCSNVIQSYRHSTANICTYSV